MTQHFETLPLERAHKELLSKLVEASRSVPREELYPYASIAIGPSTMLVGPGLRDAKVSGSDLRDLERYGLLRMGFSSKGNPNYEVTPEGRAYYDWMKSLEGDSTAQVEQEVRTFLDASAFRSRHPRSYDQWSEALSMLWSAETETALTQIGHACREAMQTFATELVENSTAKDVDPDESHVENRVRSVIETRRTQLGGRATAWLDAMILYWRTVSDLAQKQEHGSKHPTRKLTWEDGRRTVFQTAVTMFEIERAVSS